MMMMIVMVNMVTTITMVKIMKLVCQTGGGRPLCAGQGLLGRGELLQVCHTPTQIHSYWFIILFCVCKIRFFTSKHILKEPKIGHFHNWKIFSGIILHNAIAITIMTTIAN